MVWMIEEEKGGGESNKPGSKTNRSITIDHNPTDLWFRPMLPVGNNPTMICKAVGNVKRLRVS